MQIPSNSPKEKFSVFKPFTLDEYFDQLFRNKPAGTYLTVSYCYEAEPGKMITETGTYIKSVERAYEYDGGVDLLSIWSELALLDYSVLYPDMVAEIIYYADNSTQMKLGSYVEISFNIPQGDDN